MRLRSVGCIPQGGRSRRLFALVAGVVLLAGASGARAQWLLYVQNTGDQDIRVAVARANGPRRDQITGWRHLEPGRKVAFGSLGGIAGTPAFSVAIAQFTPDGKLGMANYAPDQEKILLNGWSLSPGAAEFPVNPFSDFEYTIKRDEHADLVKQFPHLQPVRFSFYCFGGAENTETVIEVPSRAGVQVTPFKITAPWQQAVMDAEAAQWAMDVQRRKDNRQPPATSDLAVNRQDYWEAYQKGKVTDELRAAYFGALAAKDMHNVMLRLLTEPGTPQRELAKIMAPGDLAINPSARPAFMRWMEAVEERIKEKLRAGGKVDPLKAIDQALSESSEEQATYILERNWSEFDLAGVAMSPEQYVWMLVTRFPKPKSATEAQKLLTGLFETFGESNVREMAEKLRKAPINDKGRLTNPQAFGVTPSKVKLDSRGNMLPEENRDPLPPGLEAINGASDRWRAFRYALFNTMPRGFAMRVILDEFAYDSVDTAKAEQILSRLEAAYGKAAVDAGFEKLGNAPKAAGGGLVNPAAFNGSRHRTLFGNLRHELSRDQTGYVRWLMASQEQIDDKETLDAKWAELVKQHGEEKVAAAVRSLAEIASTPREQLSAKLASYQGTEPEAYAQFKRALASDKAPTAVADNLVTRRDYAEWSRWPEGTEVTVNKTMASSIGGKRMTQDFNVTETVTLKEKLPDQVVLFETSTDRKRAQGHDRAIQARAREDNPQHRGEPLLGATGEIALPASMNVTPVDETVTIAGKPVRCQKYMRRWRTSKASLDVAMNHIEEIEWMVWFSDDVPGTFVRSKRTQVSYQVSQHSRFKPSIMIWETAVKDFKAAGEPGPAPKRAFILPADAGKELPESYTKYGPVTTEELPLSGDFPPKSVAYSAPAPAEAKPAAATPSAGKTAKNPARGGTVRGNPKGDPTPEPTRGPSEPASETTPGPVPAGAKFCTSCGTRLAGGAKFCTGCGVKIAAPAAPAEAPSRK